MIKKLLHQSKKKEIKPKKKIMPNYSSFLFIYLFIYSFINLRIT